MPEEVAEKLEYFYKVHPFADEPTLCNIRELYKQVAIRWEPPSRKNSNDKTSLLANRYEYRFDTNAIQNGVWKNLIAFVHGFRGEDLPDLLEYQKNIFASPSAGSEALMQLYPLPSPHNHAWYYSWLDIPQLGFLKSRALYQEYLLQRRITTIITKIQTFKPEVVLMYGMDNITTLKNFFQQFFPGAKFKMSKATKLQIPQYHRADVAGTTILITTQIPALRHNRIETGFDWEEFGKRVRSDPAQ